VLQCIAVCYKCVAVYCSVSQCIAVYCSVLQCVAVCCSVLPCVTVCCSVLQRVAECCSVLQCIVVCLSTERVQSTKAPYQSHIHDYRSENGHILLFQAKISVQVHVHLTQSVNIQMYTYRKDIISKVIQL